MSPPAAGNNPNTNSAALTPQQAGFQQAYPWATIPGTQSAPNIYAGGYQDAPDQRNSSQSIFGMNNPGPKDNIVDGIDVTQLQQQQNSANRQNSTNPFGSNTQTFDPSTGQWTSSSTLGALGQSLYGGAAGLAGAAVGDETAGLNTSSLTPWGTAPSYSGATAAQGAQDAYAYAKGNLDPQWNQNQVQLQSQLAAQGLHPGDPAYDQQMNSFNTSKDTAYQQANLGSFQTGAQEAATQTGAEATAAGAADSQRMQQIQQQLTQAGWGANEIAQLLQNPAITGAPGVAQANPTQTSNNADALTQLQGMYQGLGNQSTNNLASGLGSAGVAGLSALAALA